MFYVRFPVALCAGAVSLLILFVISPAGAHDAASGWTYPIACCSNYDCREVDDAEVAERPEGYVIKVTGEVIPMTSRKIRRSPDGVFHRCSVQGTQDGATLCLFVPPRSF